MFCRTTTELSILFKQLAEGTYTGLDGVHEAARKQESHDFDQVLQETQAQTVSAPDYAPLEEPRTTPTPTAEAVPEENQVSDPSVPEDGVASHGVAMDSRSFLESTQPLDLAVQYLARIQAYAAAGMNALKTL